MKTFLLAAAICASLAAQDPDRATVPFSDANAPKRVTVNLVHGSISVKPHSNNKEVVVEAKPRGSRSSRSRREPPPGMRRIDITTTGLSVEESSNNMTIQSDSVSRPVDIIVYVPVDTSVKVSTVNAGNIEVEGISGEIDANNVNGSVTLTNVSGAVLAHALNGKLIVSLNKVIAGKAMSFSTLNGNVDVTLPADVKANVKMKSENGEIYSDFEIQLKANTSQPAVSNTKGKYKLRFDRAMLGTINGGGPEFSFTTLNGTIYIRKK